MKINEHEIRGVVFDLDGILVETEHFQWRGWVEVLKPYGKSVSQEEYFKYAGKQGDIIEAEIFEDLNLSLEKGELLERKKEFVFQWIRTEQIQLMPFAKEAVTYFFTKKLKLACASGSPGEEAILKLQKTGLFPFFQTIISGSDVERGKPFPDTYLLAVNKIGLKPEQCLAFEDTQYGIASAKAAGLVCYAIPNEFSREQDFSQADGVFNNFQEAISTFN